MDPDLVTNRCACGWEMTGPVDQVVEATIDHGKRIHNMVATRDDVLAALGRAADPAPSKEHTAR
jgi:predicted small metal-binding protein